MTLLARGKSQRWKARPRRLRRLRYGFDFFLLLQNFAQNDKRQMITLTAVLLAGGESRRMGRDKAAVVFRDEPLWRRQLRILRDLGPEEIFVSARSAPTWLADNVGLLVDDAPSRGPLSCLTKGLTTMRTTHLFVLAVDMPFMTAGELADLL